MTTNTLDALNRLAADPEGRALLESLTAVVTDVAALFRDGTLDRDAASGLAASLQRAEEALGR